MIESLRLVLPRLLTTTTLRAVSAEVLPLVTRSDDVTTLRCELALPETIRTIEFSAAAVADWTAEGLAAAIALIRYLRTEAGDGVGISTAARPAALGFFVDGRFDALGVDEVVSREAELPRNAAVFEVAVPRLRRAEGTREADAETKLALENLTVRVCDLLTRRCSDLADDVAARDLTNEFVHEGLLNIVEHAYSTRAVETQPAWIAMRRFSSPDELLGLLSGSSEDGRIAEWLRASASPSAPVLELAIVDLGVGIAASLAEAYLREHKPGTTHWWQVHDEVLRWALSAFGSRKRHHDYDDSAFARAWRGLYRVLYRANANDGFVALRSGVGMYGRGTAEEASFEARMSDLRESADRRVMPWTSLHLFVPLRPRARARREPDLTSFQELTTVPLALRQHARTRVAARAMETTRRDYSQEVRRLVSVMQTTVERESPEKLRESRVCAVIHPLIPLFDLCAPAKGRVTVQHAADVLTQIVIDASMPGIVPVHIGLGLRDEHVNEAQKLFATRHRDYEIPRNPQLCAILNGETGMLHWLLHAANDSDAALLVSTGERRAAEPVPAWWHDLATFYPDLITIEPAETPEVKRLVFHGGSGVGAPALVGALRALQSPLAEHALETKAPWWWRASSAKAFVRTTSNRYVRAFLSVNALCSHEPIFEQLLGLTARQVLRETDAGGRWLVVPDSASASFLLARRLFETAQPYVRVTHPDDFPSEWQPDDRVCMFAGAAYAGTLLAQRQAAIQNTATIRRSLVCVDVGPDLVPQGDVLMRWPVGEAVDETTLPQGASISTVDEITNELLDEERSLEITHYSTATAGENGKRLKIARELVYGLQWVDDRIHVSRCSTKLMLADEECRAEIAADVAGQIRALEGDFGADVVFMTRDSSSVAASLQQVAEATAAVLRAAGWTGAAFMATVETVRRRRRQILRHQLTAVLTDASPLAEDDRNFGQTHLFSLPPQARPGLTAVYLDNASVSGRSISEVAVGMTTTTPPVAALLAYTIIDKLPPSAERLLSRATRLGERYGTVKFRFASFLALRVATFDTFEATTLSRWLVRLARIARESGHETIETVAAEIDTVIQRVRNEPSFGHETTVLQFPLGPVDTAPQSIGTDAVQLRHVVTAHDDGLPVVHLVIEELRRLIQLRSHELLCVLAIEPDLLPDDLISTVAQDLANFILDLLESNAITACRRNALLVAVQLGDAFVRNFESLAVRALRKADTAPHFVVLAIDFIERSQEQPRGVSRIIEQSRKVRGMMRELALVPESLRYLARIEAAGWQVAKANRPETPEEAWERVFDLIELARGSHAPELFGPWWSLTEILLPEKPHRNRVVQFCKDERAWQQIRKFAQEHLVPAIHALDLLGRSTADTGLDNADTLARDVHAAVTVASDVAVRVGEGSATVQDIKASWDFVRQLTFSRSVDLLFKDNPAAVLASSVHLAVLDRALPYVVQEPVSLLLHNVERTFGKMMHFHLTVTGKTRYAKFGTALQHFEAWQIWRGGLLFSMTRGGGDLLRKCCSILIGNAETHGAPDPELFIHAEVFDEKTRISIHNVERARPGRGYGLTAVGTYLAMMGGKFVGEPGVNGGIFRITFEFPTRPVWLQPRGIK